MTVKELLGRVSSRELTEWMLYAGMEPFGDVRGDIQSAIVSCTVANSVPRKNGKTYKVHDFMPNFEPKPDMTPDEIWNVLKGISNG